VKTNKIVTKSILTFIVFCAVVTFPLFANPIVLEPVKDNTLIQQNPTNNYGSSVGFSVGYYTTEIQTHRALFQFDLSGIVEPVTSAILRAYCYYRYNTSPTYDYDAHVYRMTQIWSEMASSWDEFDSGQAWANPGGDYDTNSFASTTVDGNIDVWYEWDITALVEGWSSGMYTNRGLTLSTAGFEDRSYSNFRSRESNTNRPHLEITLVPEASLFMVFLLVCPAFITYCRRHLKR